MKRDDWYGMGTSLLLHLLLLLVFGILNLGVTGCSTKDLFPGHIFSPLKMILILKI